MSHIKGNIDQSSKLYQIKAVSDKNIISGKNDLTHILHLNELIKQSNIEELQNYIQKEKPSHFEIKIAIAELLKKYEHKDQNFYIMLNLFLNTGFPINTGINFQKKELLNNPNLEENEEVTLLNLAILLNDLEFAKIVLKYHDKNTINERDEKGLNAIINSILFNKNDNTDIINLLISHGADLNIIFKLEIAPNKLEEHSLFTLACYKNLPNVIKLLLDNPQIYVNFQVQPTGDTGLHICARGGMENALKVLLSSDKINPDILNNEGKKADKLISDNENKNEILKLFVNHYNYISNKKNDVNNNLSIMKNNNQYGNINNINKKNINNEQLNLNNINNNINLINYDKININNNNRNDEYKNYINNNNNLNNKNKMSNMSNNIEANQLRQNLNTDNMASNESSDFSEDQEIKEKINSNKNIKPQKINVNSQNPNQPLSQMNSIKILNQKIYNNLISNANSNFNFNVEIPIKMIPRKKGFFKTEKFKSLNNFFTPKLNSFPILNLDTNDKTFQLELEINELTSQIKDLDTETKEMKERIEKKKKIIEEKYNDLKSKEDKLNKLNSELKKSQENEEQLMKQQKEIISKFPEGKIYEHSNKNGNKRELKFRYHEIDELHMYKILNKDLLDYELYITERIRRQNEAIQIENKINEIKNIIKSLSQEYDVQIYGSYAMGLNMEWSDVDLVLVKNNENLENENNNDENILLMQQNNNDANDNISVANTDSTRESNNQQMLNQNNNIPYPNPINDSNIFDAFIQRLRTNNLEWIKGMNIRDNLEIKILRIECSVNIPGQNQSKRFDIDISIENEKHNGLKCVNLIKSYLNEYPMLKPITIALRAILHSANLHLPDKGGLSAYGLILMVVSYIQSQKESLNLNEPDLCGKIFYGFLKHYGVIFDFNKYLILTYPANENSSPNTDKESYINMNQYGQEFIILDPLNNTNNVAIKSYQFMNLKMAFMIAYMVTKEDCDCGCHFGEAEFENSFLSTEHCYLKRMLNSVRRFQG